MINFVESGESTFNLFPNEAKSYHQHCMGIKRHRLDECDIMSELGTIITPCRCYVLAICWWCRAATTQGLGPALTKMSKTMNRLVINTVILIRNEITFSEKARHNNATFRV